jgi:SAM-dependent methyltransferase
MRQEEGKAMVTKIGTMAFGALRSIGRWAGRTALMFGHGLVTGSVGPARGSGPKRIGRLWDRQAAKGFLRDFNRRTWSGIAQVHENHNALITGKREYYWITYVRDQYFPGGWAGDTLSLGCGEGHFDRILNNCGFRFNSFTGVDLSAKSIDRAKEEAEKIPLSPSTRYITADLNAYRPPANSFDFMYFFQSLHHIEALEELLEACARALRPTGILMVNDFVGPSRFQWTNAQLEMANEVLQVLPEELRRDLSGLGLRLKKQVRRRTINEMMTGDPSEAVRSGEIEALLRRWFDIIEEKPWGGTLNNLIFEDIAGNFNSDKGYHRAIIELLIRLENTVVEAGILPSDFKFFMARPRMTG